MSFPKGNEANVKWVGIRPSAKTPINPAAPTEKLNTYMFNPSKETLPKKNQVKLLKLT